ncbi:hypothetical protein T439DRAFT_110068 [Meredithblackwellia eburnea MCA 4105]
MDPDVLPLASQDVATAILGPFSVGWTVNLIGAGGVLACYVSYLSSPSFRHDPPRIRWLVSIVCGLIVCQGALCLQLLFHYSTSQRRDIATLATQTIPDALESIPVGVEGFLVQLYLARRASGLFQVLWQKVIFTSLVGALMLTGLGESLLWCAAGLLDRKGQLDRLQPLTQQMITALWLWFSAVKTVSSSSPTSRLHFARSRLQTSSSLVPSSSYSLGNFEEPLKKMKGSFST